MHIDLEKAAAGRQFKARFCVIGAGIAGLLLATRLAERLVARTGPPGAEVLLLEAGGLEQEDRSQHLYAAEMATTPGAALHTGTTEGRFRTFGGSSTRWGGQLLPYTDDVFSPPPGTGSAGWPVRGEDVRRFDTELQQMLGTDLLPFDAALLTALKRPAVEFSGDIRLRFSKWIPFAKRNLARTLGQAALAHARITVVSHANVAGLLGQDGRIATARVLDYAGREFRVQADHFVVATGTIESSRLLLSSPAVPNPHDQMGRYFHDHVSAVVAQFEGTARTRMLERLGPFFVAGTLHTCKLEASPALREREGLLAVMAHLTVEEPEDSGTAAVRNLLKSVQRGNLRKALRDNLPQAVRGASDVARLLYFSRFKQRRAVSKHARVRLLIDLEQPPRAESRIRLSDPSDTANALDALGLRKAVVEWQVGAEEATTAVRFTDAIKAELEALGLPPASWETVLEFHDTYHAMGGLRMGTDARESVVDPNLRVHGMENLYVASCAVYPSGGSSNPTFTLMGLTLALAERLMQER